MQRKGGKEKEGECIRPPLPGLMVFPPGRLSGKTPRKKRTSGGKGRKPIQQQGVQNGGEEEREVATHAGWVVGLGKGARERGGKEETGR